MIYRHGDVILKGVQDVGPVIWAQPEKEYVLARGEQTGHHHLLTAMRGGTVTMGLSGDGAGGTVGLMEIEGGATLTHEEHKTLKIAAGTYEIIKEREYDFFTKEGKVRAQAD